MSSLYTNPVPLHKFKYVGDGIDSVLKHKFKYIFQEFLVKYETQIFLSDMEIKDISKKYTNVFVDKLLRGTNKQYIKRHLNKLLKEEKLVNNLVDKKFIDKCSTSILNDTKDRKFIDGYRANILNKIKINIDGNIFKVVPKIDKTESKLINDFDRDISFITIFNGSKLTMRIPDVAPPKSVIRKVLLTDFNREVVFINKINNNIRRLQTGFDSGIEKVTHDLGRLKILEDIDRLTMMLKINHYRKASLINIGTGDNYLVVPRKMLFNYTRLVTLIDIRRKSSRLLYDRINELIKTSNRVTHLSEFLSRMTTLQKATMLTKLEEMNEINKIDFVRKYLVLSIRELLKKEVLVKYFIKQNNGGLNINKSKFKYLVKNEKSFYKYKVELTYVANTYCKLTNKIDINRKYFSNVAKDIIRLKYEKFYLGSGIKEFYKYNMSFRGLKHHAKFAYYFNVFSKYLSKKVGISNIMVDISNIRKYLKHSNKEMIVTYHEKNYLKRVNKEIVKLCNVRFIKQKIRFDIWRTENNSFKDIKKIQRYINKISCEKIINANIQKMFKTKTSEKFYEIPIAFGCKFKSMSKLLYKTSIKLEKINIYKIIFKMPLHAMKNKHTILMERILQNLNKVKIEKKIILTYKHMFKKSSGNYLNNMITHMYHYQPQLRYLDKTCTRIYSIKNVTKFLELKRRWWILEHDELTDKLIIPNIDYPYETEPVIGIDKHPVSSITTINYADINIGKKEIEVSIRIMQQMLNSLFVIWNGAYSDFVASSTTEAIEKIMSVYYTWLNIPQVVTEMETKKSREDYLRIYRWFRWEAEKIWIKEKDNKDSTGAKTIGMLVANIIEYMKIHHYNVVPITNRHQLFELDNMMTAFKIQLWDYYRRPDKKKGKRKYVISTVNNRTIKKRFILKI